MEKIINNNPEIIIKKFVLFHKRRISLLRELVKEKIHERLIFQISFLGFESLARVLYPEKKSGERFVELLSKAIGEKEATHLYKFWRCPLTHEGFIQFPKTDLIKGSVEYPSGSIIAIYEDLINHLDDFFRKTNTKIRGL